MRMRIHFNHYEKQKHHAKTDFNYIKKCVESKKENFLLVI